MPIASSSGGKEHAPIPAGTALAVCYGVIDVGTPPQVAGGFPSRRKVLLQFELPHVRGEFTVDGVTKDCPRVISESYTLSTDKKSNLRKQLAAWRGKDFTEDEAKSFDVAKVCGAMALLSIVHKPSRDGSKVYANIAAIMKPMAGTERVKPENPAIIYDIPKEGPITIPDTLPEWIANRIKASDEYTDRLNPARAAARKEDANPTGQAFPTDGDAPDDDSIPF